MCPRALVPLAAILVFTLPATADVINVDVRDENVPQTIYQGLYLADDGDTVLVAPGTYRGIWNRNLDFEGKRVSLLSSAGPESTIIDCEGLGRAFYFHSGEDSASIVRGFTVRRGSAGRGGAIHCEGASPTLDDLILTRSAATNWHPRNGGGGLYCGAGAAPVVTRVVFFENEAKRGGAVYCNGGSDPTITECTLADNVGLFSAAGVFCRASSPIIENTIIAWSDAGNAVSCVEESHPTFSRCVIYANPGGDDLCGDASDNLFEDPLFCDHEHGDLFVCSDSPCLPENNAYGVLIGARGESDCSCPGEPDCETLTVPGAYGTIAAALAAAGPCDTVLVAPGTYHENSLRLPLGVTLRSTGGPDETTIDAGWTGTSGVLIGYGGGERRDFPASRLSGFTIRGCGDSAIKVRGSSPIIEDCAVIGNWSWEGGGLRCEHDGSPLVRNVSFIGNRATWMEQDSSGGGAVFCGEGTAPSFEAVVFLGNSARAGGAVYCAPGSEPELTECTITMSTAERGAISVRDASAAVSRTVVAFNDAGPAFHCVQGGKAAAERSLFFANAGGDFACVSLMDCLFEDPLFCDLGQGNVEVCDESPCLPENNPHGILIGAGKKGLCPCPVGRVLEVPDEFATITDAMGAAAPADTVLVAAGTYHESDVQVPWGVTLLGEEGPETTVIDASAGGSALILGHDCYPGRGGGTVIEGLTVTGATDSGIRILNSDPLIRNCIIAGNTSWLGGGILCRNASPRILDSTFTANSSPGDDAGGALYCWGGSPLLENLIFYGNRAFRGGAVCARKACNLAVANCTFVDNAAQWGSAIFTEEASADISRSIVSFNDPARSISCGSDSDVAIRECVVYANGPTDSLCGAHFSNLFEDPLLCDRETGDLRPCPDSPCLPENNPYGVHIGALGVGDCACPEPHQCGTLRVPQDFSTIAEALASASRCDTVLVSPGTYAERGLHLPWGVSLRSAAGPESTVIDAGGEGTIVLIGCLEDGGRPRSETGLDGFTLTGATASAIRIVGGSPTISNCVVTENFATAGGGMHCERGTCPLISNVVFSDNTATGVFTPVGGAVHCHGGSGPIFSHVTFRANRAALGGAVHCSDGSPIVDHCTFSDNRAEPDGGGCVSSRYASSLTITNSILAFTDRGGAVDCFGGGSVLVRRCLLWENAGGDVECGTVEEPIVEDPLFCDREAGDFTLDAESPCLPPFNPWGGAIGALGQGCGPTVWHVLPDGSGDAPSIQAAIDSCPPGGIVAVGPGTHENVGNVNLDLRGKPLLVRSALGPEVTTIDCGGDARAFLFQSGEDSLSTVRGFTIENGAAESGGAFFLSAASPVIEGCTVRSCTAQEGGALSCEDGASPIVRDVIIEGNRAGRGGGIWIKSSSPLLADVSILGNTSEGDGGGMCLLRNAGPTLRRCTIADNAAGGFGGGVYSWISHGTVENVTFVGNSAGAHGGAFCGVDSDPTLNGVILAFSTAGEGIYCEGANEPVLARSDVYGNGGGDEICGIDGGGNISLDPLFCELFGQNLELCSNTPCTGPLVPNGHMGRYGIGCETCSQTSVDETGTAPPPVTEARVSASPNPMTPGATIAFELPRPADVELSIYDVAGRKIATLSEGRFGAGRTEVAWDGADASRNPAASGIYFVRLAAGSEVATEKLVLLRR